MKDRIRYDVFISYRRKGGEGMARLLYERLTKLGYRVAYDLETLEAGRFDGQILRDISSCRDVVVVLTADSLARCKDAGDMFRQEIAFALRTERNVIPLMAKDFRFPSNAEDMPDDIRPLRFQNGVGADMEYFDGAIARLQKRLKAKPVGKRRFGLIARALAAVAAIALAGLAAVSFWHPKTEAIADSTLNELLYGIAREGSFADIVLRAQRELDESLRSAVQGQSERDVSLAYAAFTNTLLRINPADYKIGENDLEALRTLPVDLADFRAMGDMLRNDYSAALIHAKMLLSYLHGLGFERPGDIQRLFTIYSELYSSNAKFHAYGIMSLLRNIPDEKLETFKNKTALAWSELDELHKPWLKSEPDLNRLMESSLNRATMRADELEHFKDRLDAEVKAYINLTKGLTQ